MTAKEIKARRRELGVNLRELSKGLGPGFSEGRLSAWERGQVVLEDWDVRRVALGVERIGEVRSMLRRAAEKVDRADWSALFNDIRTGEALGGSV